MTFYDRLLKLLHKLYRKDKFTLELIKAISKQLEESEKNIEEIGKQQYLDSASWGLDIFEQELNIKGKTKPIEQRQAVIKAKWRGAGKLTLFLIQRTLQSYITGNIIVKFQKRLLITMQGEKLEAIDFYDVTHTIEEVKPAHIGFELSYILPEIESNIKIGSIVQVTLSIEVFPDTQNELESEGNIISAVKTYIGIYLEVEEE